MKCYISHRIDHLLGKDLIENLTVLRFSNLVFEPLWSRTYIRNVQVNFTHAQFTTFYLVACTLLTCPNCYRSYFLKKQQQKSKGGEFNSIHFFEYVVE